MDKLAVRGEPPPWSKNQVRPPKQQTRYSNRDPPWTKKQGQPPPQAAHPPKPAPWTRNEAPPSGSKGAVKHDSYRAPWSKGASREMEKRPNKVTPPFQTEENKNRQWPQAIVSEGGVAIGPVSSSKSRPNTAMEKLLDPTLAHKLDLKRRGKREVNYLNRNARKAVISPTKSDQDEAESPSPYLHGHLAAAPRTIPKHLRSVKSKFREEVSLQDKKSRPHPKADGRNMSASRSSSRSDRSRPGTGSRPDSAISRPGTGRKTAVGKVPAYLKDRKAAKEREDRAKKEKARLTEGAPPGHVLMEDSERREVLAGLGTQLADAIQALQNMGIATDTLRSKQKRAELENKVADLEDGLRFFSRKKVYVKAKKT